MTDHTYKTIEITGSSKSIEAAVESALTRTSETVQNCWFEVDSIRGHLEDGRIDRGGK